MEEGTNEAVGGGEEARGGGGGLVVLASRPVRDETNPGLV